MRHQSGSQPCASLFRMGIEPTAETGHAPRLGIDRARHRAQVGSQELQLEPRAFALLAELAAHPGEVQDKQTLFERVWQRRVVGDAALSQAIARIRRELIRCGGDSEWIRTVHGVGYAFDGPMESPVPASEPDAPVSVLPAGTAQPSQRRRFMPHWALVTALLALIALGWWRTGPEPGSPRLAIAPFDFDAHAGGLDYGDLALPSLLGSVLEQRAGVTVIPPERVRRGLANLGLSDIEDEAERARAIRELFGVDHVLFARLDRRNEGLALAWKVHSAAAGESAGLADGGGIGAVVQNAARRVAGQLDVAYSAGIPIRRLVQDEFVNEAFARGMQALLSGDLPAAERYFGTALQDAPESGWLHYERGNATRLQGKVDDAAADYTRALAISAQDSDHNLAGAAETGLGLIDWRGGRMDAARARFERARASFLAVGNRANLAAAIGNLGILADNRGELDSANTLYEEALSLYREQGERAGESAAYSNLAVIARKRGQLDRAADLQLRGLELQRRAGLGQLTIFSATHLAEIERRRGRWHQSAELLDEAAAAATRANDALSGADIVAVRAALAADMGDAAQAQRNEEQALATYVDLKHGSGEMRLRQQRIERRLDAGDRDSDMHEELGRVLSLAREFGDRDTELSAGLLRAELDGHEADAAVTAAIAHAQAAGDPLLEARARRAAARWSGRVDELERAYHAAARSAAPREQALLALELARKRIAAGQLDSIDALIGRVEAWRADHPQTLALRACQQRLAGRSEEAGQLDRRALVLPGARVASGWCPDSAVD